MTKNETATLEFIKTNNLDPLLLMLENIDEKAGELTKGLEKMAKNSGLENIMKESTSTEEKQEWLKYWISRLNRIDEVLALAVREVKSVEGGNR